MAGMEVISNAATILSFLGFLGLLLTTVRTWKYTVAIRRVPGIGRIIFWALATFKLWAALVLAYLLILPYFNEYIPRGVRTWLRLFLALYLTVQTFIVYRAYGRYEKPNGHHKG